MKYAKTKPEAEIARFEKRLAIYKKEDAWINAEKATPIGKNEQLDIVRKRHDNQYQWLVSEHKRLTEKQELEDAIIQYETRLAIYEKEDVRINAEQSTPSGENEQLDIARRKHDDEYYWLIAEHKRLMEKLELEETNNGG